MLQESEWVYYQVLNFNKQMWTAEEWSFLLPTLDPFPIGANAASRQKTSNCKLMVHNGEKQ